MRRVRCPVLVLTGDQEDTWRELAADELAERVGVARRPPSTSCPAPATTSTSRTPTRRWRTSSAFVAEVGPVTDVVVLHDLGSAAAGEPWRAAAPARVARARPPRAREPARAAARRLRPDGPGDARPLGARPAAGSWSASARTPTARSSSPPAAAATRSAIVDGAAGAPWLDPDAAIAARVRRRCGRSSTTPAPSAPPPAARPRPPDDARLRRRGVGHLRPAVLGLGDLPGAGDRDTRRRRRRPSERSERVAWFGGPTSLVELRRATVDGGRRRGGLAPRLRLAASRRAARIDLRGAGGRVDAWRCTRCSGSRPSTGSSSAAATRTRSRRRRS